MNRAGFLSRLFGAAVVTAMPKVVVDQIEKLPPVPPPPPPPVTYKAKTTPIPNGSNHVYIFNDNCLIAHTERFELSFKQELIPVDSIHPWKKERVWTGEYKKNGKKKYKYQWVEDHWHQYVKAPAEWHIQTDKLKWAADPREVFHANEKLNCLAFYNGAKLKGDLYISEMSVSSDFIEGIDHSAVFVGSGALVMDFEKGEK